MAAASIVYENMDDETNVSGDLFAGKAFWLAQRLPLRKHLLRDVESNGGTVVILEKKADYCIVDHCRQGPHLPGSISYTFIEKSIKNKALEDPQNHLVGPAIGYARPAGSLSQPIKTTRTPYTAEEDRILWKWVQKQVSNGGSISGNEVYKHLEAKVSWCNEMETISDLLVSSTYMAVLERSIPQDCPLQTSNRS